MFVSELYSHLPLHSMAYVRQLLSLGGDDVLRRPLLILLQHGNQICLEQKTVPTCKQKGNHISTQKYVLYVSSVHLCAYLWANGQCSPTKHVVREEQNCRWQPIGV